LKSKKIGGCNNMNYEELVKDHEVLQQKYNDSEADNKQIVENIVKLLNALGLLPFSEDEGMMKKILKAVKNLATDAMLNPKGLERKFDFLKEIAPLIDKNIKKYGLSQ